MNNNMDSLNEVLSVNFKNEIPNGLRHNKESYMASLKKGHHQLHKILDYDINIEVINNNLAIISGLGETDRTQNSKREQTKIKFVDIYYNENGTWKSVFYTASVVK
ncbi:MAG: nuclear transport factor 2 family protein [Alphaproteobacteria bacterium]|nr:nuclear transport factor 2 family protein [Alphaproteobacteria bacterium]